MNISKKLNDFITLEQGSAHTPKLVGLGASILASAMLANAAHADGHNNHTDTHSNSTSTYSNAYANNYSQRIE